MTASKWYEDGLSFSCTQCGNCCTGAPGYVWVNQAEIKALAELVGEDDLAKFEREHVVTIGIRKSLRELPDSYDCVFFDSQARRCTVYEARPRQCRTWPFWDSNLRSTEAWQRTCDACPGAGQGPLYELEEIEEQRKVFRV